MHCACAIGTLVKMVRFGSVIVIAFKGRALKNRYYGSECFTWCVFDRVFGTVHAMAGGV